MKQFSTLILMLISSVTLFSQNFEENFIRYTSTGLGSESGCMFYDYDADGQMDVITGFQSRKHLLHLKNQSSTFSIEVLADTAYGYAYFKRIDFDGNGVDDYIVSVRNNSAAYELYLFLADSAQNFTQHFMFYAGFDRIEQVEVADIDQDGDNDVVVDVFANLNAFYLLENDGNYNFSWSYVNFNGGPSELYGVADMDGDGLPDIVGAHFDFGINQFKVVAMETDTTGGIGFTEHLITTRGYTREGVVGQFTGDSLPDVLLSTDNGGTTLFLAGNVGSFNFSIAGQPIVPASSIVRLPRDYDGDGDLDVLLTANEIVLFKSGLSSGTGFTQSTVISNYVNIPQDWADINGDGLNDLLLGNRGTIEVWTQNATGTYSEFWKNDESGRYTLEIMDVDLNGKMDLVMTDNEYIYHIDQNSNEHFMNTRLYQPNGMTITSGDINDIQPFDKDGDGDMDMLMTYRSDIYLMTNNNGTFTATLVNNTSNGVSRIDTADFDGDGNLEFIVMGTPDQHLEWNGTSFTSTNINVGGIHYGIMDVDGDGDKDLIYPDWNINISNFELRYLPYNNGFTGSQVTIQNIHSLVSPGITHNDSEAHVADTDGDGDDDFVVLNEPGEEVYIFRNDGNSTFTGILLADSLTLPNAFAQLDVDGDNDLDLLIGELTQGRLVQFINDGSGNYTSSVFTDEVVRAEEIRAVDFDQDGDQDVISMSWLDRRVVFFENQAINCPRQFAFVNDSICLGDSLFVGGAYQTTAGVYRDTLSTVLGCDSIITTTLDLRSTPVFSSVITICPGDSAMIHGVYQSALGIYSDTVSASNGCDSILETELKYFAVPSLQVGYYVAGMTQDDLVYFANSGFANYDWYVDGNLIQSSPSDTFYLGNGAVLPHILILVATSSDGCIVSDTTVYQPWSVDDWSASTFKIYPNPAKTSFEIETQMNAANTGVQLLSISGTVLRNWDYIEGASYSIDGIAAGVYLVRIEQEDRIAHLRLVIE